MSLNAVVLTIAFLQTLLTLTRGSALSRRQADSGTKSQLLEQLEEFIEQTENRFTSLEGKISQNRKEVNEELDNIKAKLIRCEAGWFKVDTTQSKTITFSRAFSTKPSMLVSVTRWDKGSHMNLYVSPTSSGATIGTPDLDGAEGIWEIHWIACGH